ncbi:MAG: tRNA pseudouridine(38-40) synthase TruA [Legionellales bacterium]|nr:tRNA pseudouridine(38-40) synthase TruA [Legionellales bacterium]
MNAPESTRWAMCVAYLGADYAGWQLQPTQRTVQGVLDQAIASVANHAVSTICAGRTDRGVHALMQVVHFDAFVLRTAQQWLNGINANLPEDIVICWVKAVPRVFDARLSALERTYVYVIDNATTPRVHLLGRAVWFKSPLDVERMHHAAQAWVGEHDFSALRASGCQSNTPVRTIHHVSVTRQDDWVVMRVTANAFLYHMIRNAVGVLLPIGQGRCAVDWAQDLLEGRTRQHQGITAPAHGLYLHTIKYGPEFDLPQSGQSLPLFDDA